MGRMGTGYGVEVKVASEAPTCPQQAARRWRHGEVPEYIEELPNYLAPPPVPAMQALAGARPQLT